jgi:hypothetical protein
MTEEHESGAMRAAVEANSLTVATDVIELGLSMFPVIGGPMSGGMAIIRGHRAQARTDKLIKDLRDECTNALREAVEAASQDTSPVDLASLIEDNAARFMPLVERVLSESQETADEEKLKRMRRGLGSLLGHPITAERDQFLRLVCRYQDLEVFILQKLAELAQHTHEEVPKGPDTIWEFIANDLRDSYSIGQIRALTTTLEGDGLLVSVAEGPFRKDPAFPHRGYENTNPSVGLKMTDRGFRFLDYLSEGDAREEAGDQ